MRSLRGRMMVGTIVGTLAVLSCAGGGLYLTLRRLLQDDFNAALASKASALTVLVEEDKGRVELDFDPRTMREFEAGPGCEYLQLARPDGTVLHRSPSLSGQSLVSALAPGKPEVFSSVVLPDGRPGRVVSLTFTPREGSEDEKPAARQARATSSLVLSVARETRPLDRALARLAALLAAVGMGSALVCALVLGLVVRGGLRPLDQLASRLNAIGEDPSAQVDLPNAPAELKPVVQRLNELLRRLGAAFARERRFSADIAHDLRTPLAGLRTTLEVALGREREPAEYRQVLHDSLQITGQMQSVTSNLLALARAEAGQLTINVQHVDVVPLLRTAWSPLAETAAGRGVQVRWEAGSNCCAMADPGQLSLVIANLFGNAVNYVNAGGDIRIETSRQNDRVCITVSNTGCTLTAEQAGHVFDRLWRGDESRMGTQLHCGLGLSLARRITELLDGAIEAHVDDGVFTIQLCIPASHI